MPQRNRSFLDAMKSKIDYLKHGQSGAGMDAGREIVQIHIGQCGIQIAHACWDLYCLEHGVLPDGRLVGNCPGNNTTPFFETAASGKITPRAIFADLEPTTIDEMRRGPLRYLFSPSSLVSGKEDASSNFARGYYSIGRELIDLVMDRIRQSVSGCNSLQGFIVFRASGGGTGSGLGSLILEAINRDYPKTTVLEYAIYPAPTVSPVILEPYNAILETHNCMNFEDACLVFDNEALYNICDKKLHIANPTYTNLNRIVAQVVSSTTASIRFQGTVNMDLAQFKTNLIPYPRLHFPLVSYAPIIAIKNAQFEPLSIASITDQCFDQSSVMMKCDPRRGKYLACCLVYRGDCNESDVNNTIAGIKANKSLNFVEWSPVPLKVGFYPIINIMQGRFSTTIRDWQRIILRGNSYCNYYEEHDTMWVGICDVPTASVPGGDLGVTSRSVCLLANSTAVKTLWMRLVRKFDMLYKKNAYVYHYISEGMEQNEFENARNDIQTLIGDYEAVDKP